MLNSFRIRLILAFFIVLTLVQIATAFSVLTATHADNLQQQQKSLEIGSNVFLEVLANRGAQLNQSLSVLSADFGFKRAIATGEQETIESVLDNHGSRIGADAAILLSPDGRLISSSISQLYQEDIGALFDMKNNKANSVAVINVDHTSYQFVLQPVRAPTLIAWVGMGFLLDKKVAEQAKSITGIDISFVNLSASPIEIASTLATNAQRSVLTNLTLTSSVLKQATENMPTDYLSIALQLNARGNGQWALLHQSNLKWQQSYQQLRNNMLLIFAFTLVLAIMVAIRLSGSLSRPVRQLVIYARQIGQGEVPKPIQGAPAELQLLASSLSVMRDDIVAREKDLAYQSNHDSLTGLLNRSAAKRLLAASKEAHSGTLVLLDIKHFRHINDIIGFANADHLLVLFTERLTKLAPTPDLIARLDGDSFLLQYQQGSYADQLLTSLDMLEAPFPIQGSNIALTVRAGLLSIEGNGDDIDVLIRRVEIALNEACLEDQRIVTYRQGSDEKYQRELIIIRDLPIGLGQNQLYLVFQPKVDLHQNQCIAAEALIRWQHPELGFIPPDEFIRLAEHSGNIEIVSQWVITEAIVQLARWQQQGIKLKLAINLSAHDLIDSRLPNQISRRLQDNQVPPSALCIEVTEGAVMKDTQTVVAVLQQFRDMGISVAIDDFGTGHSSLAYLKVLPVNEVKIDRSFVKDMLLDKRDVMIVNSTINMIHGLGFTAVVEGVEETEGVAMLRDLGCDIIQGYVFSKPLKQDDFTHWLAEFNATHLDRENSDNKALPKGEDA